MNILVINPGSTSTKMAVYEDEKPLVLRSISHSAEELAQFDDVIEQQDYRKQLVLDELQQMQIPLHFDAVIDFDALTRDPAAPDRLRPELSDDWLHLNAEGYRVMGEYAATFINGTAK